MSKQNMQVGKQLRIERNFPENLQSHYVSNIVVQHEPDIFIISFFELWPPVIIADSKEEKQRALGALDHVDAKCVARLVVTPAKMKEFIAAMQENYQNYEQLLLAIRKEK